MATSTSEPTKHENDKSASTKPEPTKQVGEKTDPKKPAQQADQTGVKTFTLRLNTKQLMSRGFVYFFLFLLFLPFLISAFSRSMIEDVSLSQLVADIREEKVEKIEVRGSELRSYYGDDAIKITRKEDGQQLVEVLRAAEIDIASIDLDIQNLSFMTYFLAFLPNLLLIVVMVAVLLYFLRQARGSQEGIMGIGRSKAKLFVKGKQNITFKDVGGMDEAKKELEEIVDFLRHPKKYTKIGARTPKGVLLVGPSGTGKCVTGDTLITTNKGLMEIREVPRYYYVDPKTNTVHGAGLASFDTKKVQSTEKHASHFYDLGEQETIKVTLSQGFSIEGTPEHPIVVMSEEGKLEFRRLDSIRKGDAVAIQFGRKMFGNLKLIDMDTAYLMGLLTGDGNLSHASRVGLTSIDDEIVTFFKSYVMKRFDSLSIYNNGQSYLVSDWNFKKYLYQLGMSYLLSFDKSVPATILQSPQEVQVAFLQGLFDTDAAVSKSRAEFEYTTVSQHMARQIQMMLLNLGVVATLNQKGKVENGYKRPVYRITLTGARLKTFSSEVGFRLTRKQSQLEKHVEKMASKVENTNIDVIPGIGTMLDTSWRELSYKKLSTEPLARIIDKVRQRMRVTRRSLTEYVQHAKKTLSAVSNLEYFEQLLDAQLFFSPVVETERSYARVYDFTVPKTHSFLGNGMINHNTLMARAVAGEAGVQFLSIAGSEFMEMLVGVGASRARDLFTTAKKIAPSIIFIDEIDAIGRVRGHGSMGGHDEREQTLNQILVEMDGFTQNDNVMVMAATNRGDMLDPALVRPGRFDRRVTVNLPDLEERKFILSIHSKNKPFGEAVAWEKVARRTVGFSGADIENMLNEAAIAVAREERSQIVMEDIEEASLKVKLGPSKRRLQDKVEREMTAYHEAGHAVIAHVSKHSDPVHRISIVSRGRALGFTLTPPERDKLQTTKSELIDEIAVLLGGRAAETLIFNELTAGASSDIDRATRIARAMVVDYGMSKLGPMNFAPQYETTNYSRAMGEPMKISDKLQEVVDAEIRDIIDVGEKRALSLLKKYRKQLDLVSENLLEFESLDGDEFTRLMGMVKAKI